MTENKGSIRNGNDGETSEANRILDNAVLGSVFGPLGTVVGAIAGALSNQVGEHAEDNDSHEPNQE